MDKEQLFQRAHSMIMSSTKQPKQMILSTVKIADLFGVQASDIDKGLKELVQEGRLKQIKLENPPYHNVYCLPQ